MQQVPLMGVVEGICDRRHDVHHLFWWHPVGIAFSQQLRRVSAVDVIHRNPQLTVLFTSIVDGDDMRMPQGRGDVSLAGEALPVFVINTDCDRKNFQRFAPGQPGMLGEIHLAHSARPQESDDRVASEYFPLSDRHAGILSSESPTIREIDVGTVGPT
ncbi:hypothetical protein TL10_10190 [Mycolicibacterium llatzerense]|uniref:Uncharacterized protein n=1 Tax=Mycolicibacterium llatzerense TaxID=280871 RepID=A0A0D1JX48_9MYCO|nr:hypothetical protein TL10_10190 [Mycolicibacterium llatzerense]MCT7368525.1 hypothetical protein [Mycolicibacterium llatzerense]